MGHTLAKNIRAGPSTLPAYPHRALHRANPSPNRHLGARTCTEALFIVLNTNASRQPFGAHVKCDKSALTSKPAELAWKGQRLARIQAAKTEPAWPRPARRGGGRSAPRGRLG